MNKIETYLGFCIRAGKLLYGIDNIVQYKKAIKLIVMCHTASPNLEKECIAFVAKKGTRLVKTEEKLELLLNKTNCKVVAVLDKSLADAIASCNGGNGIVSTRKQSN